MISKRNINTATLSRQRGVSIVELMVTMTLGLFLLAALVTILLNGKQAFGSANHLSRLQENGRIASNLIVSDLKRAGYMGGNSNIDDIGGSSDQVIPNTSCNTGNNSWGRMISEPVFGLNDTNAGYACIPNGVYLRGDVLTMRYASPSVAEAPLNANQLYLRSSLFEGRIFVGGAAAQPANSVLDTPQSIRELIAYTYFIGDSGRTCGGQLVPSLFRVRLNEANGQPIFEELLPGVENLQLQYRTGGQYVNANNVTNWGNIDTVRLWLLIRAECGEQGFNDGRTYNLGDQVFTPGANDNFRRQLYSSVVMIRN